MEQGEKEWRARVECNAALCSLVDGLHFWDGSRWWDAPLRATTVNQGLPLPCMRGRGPSAPHIPLPLPVREPGERSDVRERARHYIDKMPHALSGSGGHAATFAVAVVLMRGFGLQADDAMALMLEYNARCQPEWSRSELAHKLLQAARARKPQGYLLRRK
jgi:hypothetical protein